MGNDLYTLHKSSDGLAPPVIIISREVRRSKDVNKAYSLALDEYGPIIIVPRHGRQEYVIDHRHTQEVLTDTKNFEFERVAFEVLHFGFLAVFDDSGRFVHDIHNVVESGAQPRMNSVIEQISPVFKSYFDKMDDELFSCVGDSKSQTVEVADMFVRMQVAVAHAMVVLVLGHEYASTRTAEHFAAVAVAMANMTGMHENTHEWAWAPSLWVLLNGIWAVTSVIIPRFFFAVVPALWRRRHIHAENGIAARHAEFVPLFDYLLAKNYHGKTGISALTSFVWCVILCVGLIFASVHQTVVAGFWVLVHLAQKQDQYLSPIRDQWLSFSLSDEHLNVPILSKLTLLDSFIREVLRTKGDTWGPVRQTTKPVQVGQYLIPENAMCYVLISRVHQHPDNYGLDGTAFDGFRWVKKGQSAAQATSTFLTFGLGRWACPGRQLAIHEIKMMILMLFSRFDVSIKQDTYRVLNTINTTSVAPEATLLLKRRGL